MSKQPETSDARSPILSVLLLLPYAPASFMQADLEILSRHFNLDVLIHNRGKLHLALGVLRRLILNRPDVLLMWFIVPSYALPVALLARLMGARVAFVTGGYDIVGMSDIGFGALRFPIFRLLLRLTIPFADLLLPFSQSAARQLRTFGKPRHTRVIYPGVDTAFFTPHPVTAEREPLVLTVSAINSVSLRQKGLDTFVRSAAYAPQLKWVLVGSALDDSIEQLREIATPNVEFIDHFVSTDELRDLYRRATCYVQASIHEGFGIAVAEAMSCGTVPVVTRRWSLPEVAAELGSYVPLDDPQAVAKAAIASLHSTGTLRHALRSRIVANFPIGRRERELTDALLALVPDRRRLSPNRSTGAPVKIDLGCGSLQKPGFWGIDLRPTRATVLTADAQALPIATSTVDELHASCLLEHFDAPYRVLDEVHRVLKPTGKGVFRLPNLGTYSSHLDTTHRFLADLALWRSLMEGYFAHVEVQPVGTKYRDSRSLVAVNWLLVNVLKWHELAQGWDFICMQPRPEPTLSYVGWWEENEHSGRVGGQTTPVR